MDLVIANGSASGAYTARDALIERYADLAQDRELIRRMTQANELIRRAGKVDPARQPAATTPRREPLSFDPSARIDHARRTALLKQWQAQVRRFVGPPWIITIAVTPSPLVSGNLETLEAEALGGDRPIAGRSLVVNS
ncbi:MAG: hypothetical protein JO114_00945 [Planctomycetaceae bacterium]|nr:hypothetical protein [Planctomycetaceae bacterium]MBV8311216.1 hypothetical protein [Planctomycetaceae bacterium]